MAVTLHASTISSDFTAGTSLLCNKPTLSDGDWMIAMVSHRANEAQTQPGGWTLLKSNASGTSAFEVYVKYVASAASESATDYTWTWATSSQGIITIASISGAAPTNIYDAIVSISARAAAASTSPVTDRIWTRKTTGLGVMFYSTDGGNSGWTLTSPWASAQTAQTGTSSGADMRGGVGTATYTGSIPAAITHSQGASRLYRTMVILFRAATTPMPFCIRDWASASALASTTVTCPLPTSALWSPNDLHVVSIGARDATNMPTISTLPTGYTQDGSTVTKGPTGGRRVAQLLAYRRLQVGDTDQTMTWANTCQSTAVMGVIIAGGDKDAIAESGAADSTDNSTFDVPALTLEATSEELWLFSAIVIDRSTGPGIPSPFFRQQAIVQITNGTYTLDVAGNTAANPAATSTTSGNTGTSTAFQFAVRFIATRAARWVIIQ